MSVVCGGAIAIHITRSLLTRIVHSENINILSTMHTSDLKNKKNQ